ncbi:MAG: tetratricopeptide repeat protein [Saprospiraceae bacterium]|nr:tetratricopeptide repeat protein [Saprospiraceae bacterium]
MIRLRGLLVVLSLISLSRSVFTQEIELLWQEGLEKANDTLRIDFFLDKSWELARIEPSLSSEILNRINDHFYRRGQTYRQDVWFYYKGIIEKNLGHYAPSDSFLRMYYNFQLERKDTVRLAVVQMARANLYADQGLWSKSMTAVTESLHLYESLNDSMGIIRTTSKLGAILTELERLEDAKKYHLRALQIAQALKDTIETSIAFSNIGLVFEKKEDLDSALHYFEKCLDLDDRVGYEYGLIYDRNNIANIYRKQGRPGKALPYCLKALASAEDIGARSLVTYSQDLLGNIYLDLDENQKGIDLLEGILKTSEVSSKRDLSELHNSLYLAYKKMGQIELAFDHLEQFHVLHDTLFKDDITSQINQLEFQYKTERTQQELELANSEKELAQVKIKSIQNRNYILLAGLGIILLFLLYLFRLNRRIKRQNKLIEKSLSEKETLLKEIHHRVKNNLQVISSILSLQSKAEMDPNVVSALKLGQDRVRSMALIHQNLYEEDNLTGIDVKQYFEKLIRSLFHTYNISPGRINLTTKIEDLHLDVETMIPLGLIVNELITNSLKYAFPDHRSGNISVTIKEENNVLLLKVCDDGIGMDPTILKIAKKTFGYRLINTFRQQLKSTLDITGSEGTTVVMEIKKYIKAGNNFSAV